jgi:hypothetical protein
VLALANLIREHIALEVELTVLPLARQRLHDDDWAAMAPAFQSHYFPGFSALPAAQTRRLFTRIADLHLGVAGEASGHRES